MDDQMHVHLVELESELKKMKKAVDYIEGAKKIVESAEKSIQLITELQTAYSDMKASANILITKIDKVDFPSRLDKIDATISSTNQNISNAQSRIESVERNVKDEIKNQAKDINKIIVDNIVDVKSKLDEQSKKNKITINIVAINFILLLINIFLQLFKVSL